MRRVIKKGTKRFQYFQNLTRCLGNNFGDYKRTEPLSRFTLLLKSFGNTSTYMQKLNYCQDYGSPVYQNTLCHVQNKVQYIKAGKNAPFLKPYLD